MTILAIETSGRTFSLALSRDGSILGEVYYHAAPMHSEKLIPSIDGLLKELKIAPAELTGIAVSTGPGSFTGVRVGLSCAKTLAQSLRIPVVAIGTLDILKESAGGYEGMVFPLIDALRNEVFIQNKKQVFIRPIAGVMRGLQREHKKVLLIGSGVERYKENIEKDRSRNIEYAPPHMHFPRAGVLALMAEKIKGRRYDTVKPLYVRQSWAEEKNKQ